ncbi:hypothetical protein [Geothrix fermentans]|uniref:hypothetical protein n=1 Tax=Geothrix fermentans TaxID=44676 RepID=UPI0012F848DF|nr:hypothetical protein [Geothrix fermentans]
MQLLVAMLLSVSLGLNGQEASGMPKEIPAKMPIRLRSDFERGKEGDVFAMIRANKWHDGVETEVFPKALIREKLEVLVKQGNAKAMIMLADNLPWDQENQEKNKALKERRRKLVEQAAWLDEPSAMGVYADSLWRLDKNKEEAIKWWVKGKRMFEDRAKQGDPEAIVAMANYGPIPPIEDDPAHRSLFSGKEWMEWLRKAAEFDRDSACRYGMRTHEVHWIEKAANDGDWVAMVEMGRFYAFGFPSVGGGKTTAVTDRTDPSRSIPQPPSTRKTDPVKAWEWWEKAEELVGWDLVQERLPEIGSANFPKRPEKR